MKSPIKYIVENGMVVKLPEDHDLNPMDDIFPCFSTFEEAATFAIQNLVEIVNDLEKELKKARKS